MFRQSLSFHLYQVNSHVQTIVTFSTKWQIHNFIILIIIIIIVIIIIIIFIFIFIIN